MDIEWVDVPTRRGRNAQSETRAFASLAIYPQKGKAASARLCVGRFLIEELGWSKGVKLRKQVSSDGTLVRLSPGEGGLTLSVQKGTGSVALLLPWLDHIKLHGAAKVTHRVEGSALLIELPDWALPPSSAEEVAC